LGINRIDPKIEKKILEENKELFDVLEEYNRTGKLPKLNSKSQKTGQPISRIIEERV